MLHLLEPQFFRRFLGLIGTSLCIYVAFLGFLVLIQRNLMYFPNSQPVDLAAHGLNSFSRLEYKTADGLALHGYYTPPANGQKLVIVFFQGNAGDLGIRAPKIKEWLGWGYGVFLPTYRGYDGNAGEPTEQGLYEDARAALAALNDQMKIARQDVVLYGESLGTGVATQMAVEGEERALVLDVPYTSIPDIGARRYLFVPIAWLAYDRFESIKKIRTINSPLLVLKAARDSVIPPELEQQLFDAAVEPKKLITHPTADHMDIYTSPEVVNGIGEFLRGL